MSQGPIVLILKNGRWIKEEKTEEGCNHMWQLYNGSVKKVSSVPNLYYYECVLCKKVHGSRVMIPTVTLYEINHNCVHFFVEDKNLGPKYSQYKFCKNCGKQNK